MKIKTHIPHILFTTVFFSLCSILAAQMSGIYTVGGTSPYFTSLQEACDSLSLYGILAPVIINIRDGIYTGSVNLDSVAGASPINTITFQSENGDSALVHLEDTTNSVFTASTGFLIFKNLSFVYSGNSQSCLNLNVGSDYQFENCSLTGYLNSCTLLSISNPSDSIRNIQINHCHFSGGTSVFINGASAGIITIKNCIVDNSFNALSIQSNNEADHITIDSVIANSLATAISVSADMKISNLSLDNLKLSSIDSYGVYCKSSNDAIENTVISNSNIIGNTGSVNMMASQELRQIEISNCQFIGNNPATANTWGLQLQGLTLSDLYISNTTINSIKGGVFASAVYSIKNVSMNMLNLNVIDYDGITMTAANDNIDSLSFSNSFINTVGGLGISIIASATVHNLNFSQDSIMSQNNSSMGIISNNSSISELNFDHIFASNDTSTDACIYVNAGKGDVSDLTFTDGQLTGFNAIAINATQNVRQVSVENSDFYSKMDGISLNGAKGDATDVKIKGTSLISYQGAGTNITGRQVQNIEDDQCKITAYTKGVYISSSINASNLNIHNSTLTAGNGYGIYIYDTTGVLNNVSVDSDNIEGFWTGVMISGNSTDVSNINVENDTVNSTSLGINCAGDLLRNCTIKNNRIGRSIGIYLFSRLPQSSNTVISNNDINLSGSVSGIYITQAGLNVSVTHNKIDTVGGNSFRFGIVIISSDSVDVSDNYIHDAYTYGILLSTSARNLSVDDNEIFSDLAGETSYGIYVENVHDGFMNIKNNKILAYHEYAGINLTNINLISPNRGLVANNFITNMDISYIFGIVNNVSVIGNSIHSDLDVTSTFSADIECTGIQILDNIFDLDPAVFSHSVYDLGYMGLVTKMDNNVYNIDTTKANFAKDESVPHTYNSLWEWENATGFEKHSFYDDAQFVNDTSDLHLLCHNTKLIAGSASPLVTTDIDNNPRATIPTIGADEIVTDQHIFAADSVFMCGNPVMLDAGFVPGGTYTWNTGATTQTIEAQSPGTYHVTITDACGTYNDNVKVYTHTPQPAFMADISYLTASFTNTSTNAVSYSWDFGDGKNSSDINPVHVYPFPGGNFTVTLTATGTCTSASLQKQITAFTTTGINETKNSGISIFPNPSRGIFTLSLDGSDQNIDIEITDVNGRTLLLETIRPYESTKTFNISAFSNGIYFVKILRQDHDHIITLPLLLEHVK